jgi:hypothetical protein
MGQSNGSSMLVEDVPEFEFRGGLFYVMAPGGEPRAYRPNTFFAAVAAAATAARQFRFAGAEVIEFRQEYIDKSA